MASQQCSRLAQILDLLAQDSRPNVNAGKLEVRPPRAPTTGPDKEGRGRRQTPGDKAGRSEILKTRWSRPSTAVPGTLDRSYLASHAGRTGIDPSAY